MCYRTLADLRAFAERVAADPDVVAFVLSVRRVGPNYFAVSAFVVRQDGTQEEIGQ
jgi:hypothetical protein